MGKIIVKRNDQKNNFLCMVYFSEKIGRGRGVRIFVGGLGSKKLGHTKMANLSSFNIGPIH